MRTESLRQSKLSEPCHVYETEKVIYHLAIIDYLQEWNLNKMGERLFKTAVLLKDGRNLSAVEPLRYAQRFRDFCERNVFL